MLEAKLELNWMWQLQVAITTATCIASWMAVAKCHCWSQADQLFHGFKNHQDSAHNVSKAIINHPYFDGFRTHLFVVILGVDQHGMPNMGASFKKKET